MKIICVQLDSKLRAVKRNIATADKLLSGVTPSDVDFLVLPELAFTGYNFTSAEDIAPYLEPTGAGPTSEWAKRIARTLNCIVSIGYPEISVSDDDAVSKCYNATITVGPDGTVLAHYRKSFLYYTDEPWASEGDGFGSVSLPLSLTDSLASIDAHSESQLRVEDTDVIKVAMGICMDLNPYKFSAPWDAYEFAKHVVQSQASLAMINMAWSSLDLRPQDLQGEAAMEPSLRDVSYWLARLQPVVDQHDRDVVLVLANRCGNEPGVGLTKHQDTCYVGSSTVLRLGRGNVLAWGFLGLGQEGILKVDTSTDPKYALVDNR